MMNPTMCAITETWLPNDKDDQKYKEVPPPGYKILSHICSDGRRGGGIAIVYKNNLKNQGLNTITNQQNHGVYECQCIPKWN